MKTLIAAFAMICAFATAAQAGEIKLQVRPQLTDVQYYDTYPANLCGVKAIRIVANGYKAAGSRASVDIGRVYFAYENRSMQGPFSALAKVNVALAPGQTTAWVKVPDVGAGCLKSVRVYAKAGYPGYDNGNLGPGLLVQVIGLN